MDNYAFGRMTKSYNKNIIVLAGMNQLHDILIFLPQWMEICLLSEQINKNVVKSLKILFSIKEVEVGSKRKSKYRRISVKKRKKKTLKNKNVNLI